MPLFSQTQKVQPNWNPHEVKVGFNVIRAGRSTFGSGINSHELQFGIAAHEAIAILDVGFEEHTRGDNYTYTNSGNYFRSGLDWNFVKDKESGNVLSLGLRYSRAYFTDELDYTADQGFGEENYSFSNDDLRARWFEVTFNLRGRVVSNFYMGFTMRWQTFRKLSGEGDLKVYDIPGFGTTRRDNSTAFDYYLTWRLPLRSKS